VVPRAGHFAQRDQPAIVIAAVVYFLDRALAS
jgi:pimeloyl-ACP methyl ester carboxylesterase